MANGIFTTRHPALAESLWRTARSTTKGELRFPARNFLLDESVSETGAASYGEKGLADGYTDSGDWLWRHQAYLTRHVFLENPGIVPRPLDPTSAVCPQSFRESAAFATFGSAHKGLHLLRVLDTRGLSRLASRTEGRIVEAARAVLRAREKGEEAAPESISELEATFRAWNQLCDLRPVWVGFLADHEDLFGANAADDPPGWVDTLRDRLGLAHLDPGRGEMTVFVFRYPVSVVPNLRGLRDQRPLAVPTVLDTKLNEAFCPPPRDQPVGRTVDLAASFGTPAREVVHPYVPLDAKRLFRVGTLEEPVPSDLWEARMAHLLGLRDLCSRPDYAHETDPELDEVGG